MMGKSLCIYFPITLYYPRIPSVKAVSTKQAKISNGQIYLPLPKDP